MDRKISLLGFALLLSCRLSLAADLAVTFLDVGEGEAILVQNGKYVALVDAGNPMTGANVVSALDKMGIEALDAVIITHPHSDHMGGIFQILPRVPIGQRYDNGQDLGRGGDIMRWYGEYFRAGSYQSLAKGQKLKMEDARVEVLNAAQPGRSLNQNSVVLRLTHGNVTILLMGDVDTSVEQVLLASEADLSADLLKPGHHGASDASSAEFLKAVNPRYAVISINENNLRGYPAAEVLQRLAAEGAIVSATYNEGDITFVSDGKKLHRQD